LSRDSAPLTIPNLVSLFRHMKGLKIHPRVYVRILDVIAKLTVHNSAEIRALMNKEKLFALRNDLILFLLQCNSVSPDATRHFIENFDFQSIAAHTEFRESFGIHFLLRLFHDFKGGEQLYLERLFFILKKVIGGIEENKIILKELLDNDLIFKNFFGGKSLDREIIAWHFSTERAGTIAAVETKLKKILTPLDTKFKAAFEKIQAEQNDRKKKVKTRKASNAKWTNFAAIEQKRKRDEKLSREFCLSVLERGKKEKEDSNRTSEEKWTTWKKEQEEKVVQEEGKRTKETSTE